MTPRPRLRPALFAIVLALAACQSAPPPATPQPAATAGATVALDMDRFAWTDRSPFRAGLVPAQQAVLDGLPGAPVYHLTISLTQSLDAVQGREQLQYTNRTGAPVSELVFHLFPNLLGGSLGVKNVAVDGAS